MTDKKELKDAYGHVLAVMKEPPFRVRGNMIVTGTGFRFEVCAAESYVYIRLQLA